MRGRPPRIDWFKVIPRVLELIATGHSRSEAAALVGVKPSALEARIRRGVANLPATVEHAERKWIESADKIIAAVRAGVSPEYAAIIEGFTVEQLTNRMTNNLDFSREVLKAEATWKAWVQTRAMQIIKDEHVVTLTDSSGRPMIDERTKRPIEVVIKGSRPALAANMMRFVIENRLEFGRVAQADHGTNDEGRGDGGPRVLILVGGADAQRIPVEEGVDSFSVVLPDNRRLVTSD